MSESDALRAAGRRLYESLHKDDEPYELTAMIVEAARIKDRLDELDRVLSGDADVWMRLDEVRGNGDVLEIRIDSAMQESRQQANTLRQLLGEIRRQKDAAGGDGDDYDPLDDL
ncbi:hypothetical protein [Prescottella equi]|uniref:hypothetical protein n=1 Tax=Rhodococcus hoagii TaxID=43767 RepID=UPI0007CD6F95|nr:hypothetical protein [Prescottella equi]ORL01555.1 hypothetical protein A6F56_04340 [Prescottella equi]